MKSHLEDSLILQWNIYIYAKKLLFVLFSSDTLISLSQYWLYIWRFLSLVH